MRSYWAEPMIHIQKTFAKVIYNMNSINNGSVNRSLISEVDAAGFTALDSQNDRSDNISQTASYDSSDGDEEEREFAVESKTKR